MKTFKTAGVALATAAVFLIAGCGGGTDTSNSWSSVVDQAMKVTISGTQDVKCSDGLGCIGYGDFTDGTQATLTDETGKTVGVTQLGENYQTAAAYKSFVFTFVDVPRAQRYGFHAGNANRGVVWIPFDQAKSDGIHVTVGS
ncbi:hypothetical protein AB0383_20230 [Amycolatopsis sp. NPDC051373]|uniref:hypothetical protein n=1 Tax=Amycolatopsis sp. NPDC051373 TaxID=3155801 RepID=UPI00344B01EA